MAGAAAQTWTHIAIAAICVIATHGCDANAQPLFQGLGDLPGGSFESVANDVSADGTTVVGWGISASGREAFRWTAARGMVSLGELPGAANANIEARGVSGDGWLVAGRSSGTGLILPFEWTESGGMRIPPFPGNSGAGTIDAISADGLTMAGTVWTRAGPIATIWLGGINPRLLGELAGGSIRSSAADVSADGSVVVGLSDGARGGEAFIWSAAAGMRGIGDLSGGEFSSESWGVSADGLIVVGRGRSDIEVTEAFRWTQANDMVGLGHLLGAERNSVAYAVSDDGLVIVGGGASSIYPTRAFLWTEPTGMIDLKEFLTSQGLDLTGWTLTRARDISGDGTTIVGWGLSPRTQREAWIARVPSLACYADCDRSTGFGTLDIFDFLCFQTQFLRRQPYACDCDESTGIGVCDIFDFLCFQSRFLSGCG